MQTQSFHTDDGEILSLYALDIATEGGRTLLAISWQLYNDLAMKRPEILHTLADNWTLDTLVYNPSRAFPHNV